MFHSASWGCPCTEVWLISHSCGRARCSPEEEWLRAGGLARCCLGFLGCCIRWGKKRALCPCRGFNWKQPPPPEENRKCTGLCSLAQKCFLGTACLVGVIGRTCVRSPCLCRLPTTQKGASRGVLPEFLRQNETRQSFYRCWFEGGVSGKVFVWNPWAGRLATCDLGQEFCSVSWSPAAPCWLLCHRWPACVWGLGPRPSSLDPEKHLGASFLSPAPAVVLSKPPWVPPPPR